MTQQESTPGKPPDGKNTLYCSFCGKSQHEVRKLIAGPTVFICDECVELCTDIIREENRKSGPLATRLEHIPAACQVMEKEFPWNAGVLPILSALAIHLEGAPPPASRAPRILLSGPTGCGKLEMAIRACEVFGRDFIRLDASSFRASQWRLPRDPFRELLASVDFNVDRAQRSVVIIDNVDFLCRPDLVAAQEELSSILRGDGIMVAPKPSPVQRDSELLQLSTESITFVLTTHLPYEFEPERGWVTSRSAAMLDAKAAVADRLVACGLSSKIVSECTYIEQLRLPTKAEIESYLANAASSPVRECEERLAEMGVSVVFTPAAFQAIAERAAEMNFGLKSLHAIISRLTLRIAFDSGFQGSDQDLAIDGGFIRAML